MGKTTRQALFNALSQLDSSAISLIYEWDNHLQFFRRAVSLYDFLMKKLLASLRVSAFPPEHGGAKTLRQVFEKLSETGVECRVLIKMQDKGSSKKRFAGQHLDDLRAFAPFFEQWEEASLTFRYRGVQYQGVWGTSDDLARASSEAMEDFHPDRYLLCDDSLDDGRALYKLGAESGRLIFFAQTIHCLPFGPFSVMPSAELADYIARAKSYLAPSSYVQNYLKAHLNREAKVFYPPVFGAPPFPKLGRHENRFVTMINPCLWKGGSLFIRLAESCPEIEFAAVPTWGASPDMIARLRALPNMTLLRETPKIDEIFSQTRVLIAPSLCQEAFGLVSTEALLRGIPVIASNLAGLKESTLGQAELIEVEPLPFKDPQFIDGHPKLAQDEPENPIAPWVDALHTVLSSKLHYATKSQAGREAALAFVTAVNERETLPYFSA